MPHKVDDIDIRIIRELQEGARQTNQEIAQKIGLAPSTLTRRLQWLEEQNYVKGYTCIIDPEILGYNTLFYALVEFSNPSRKLMDSVIIRLKNAPEVSEICKILGGDDLIVKLYAKDITHYQKIVESIGPAEREEGYRTKTMVVTEVVYSGGVADIVRKVAEAQQKSK